MLLFALVHEEKQIQAETHIHKTHTLNVHISSNRKDRPEKENDLHSNTQTVYHKIINCSLSLSFALVYEEKHIHAKTHIHKNRNT